MDWKVTLGLLLTVLIFTPAHGEDSCTTGQEMLMVPELINNQSMTSSSHEVGSEAFKAKKDGKQGAWCPANPVDSSSYEWIQVDFGQMVTITHMLIRGEWSDGDGTRYAKRYRIEYQRGESEDWAQYVSTSGVQIFAGSTNPRTPSILVTNHTLLASRIRVVPLAEFREEVCLQMELYVCRRAGIASYSAPLGHARGEQVFGDPHYDGSTDSVTSRKSGGLGLLTNGTLGSDTYQSSPSDWLGWRSDILDKVRLLFEMDHLRNISAMRIQCNNQFSKDVRVFKQALFYTSLDGAMFGANPIHTYDFTRDTFEGSRAVLITLDPVVARFVKVVLEFDARWIMISEVTFESELVIGNYPITEGTTPVTTQAPAVVIESTTKTTVVQAVTFAPTAPSTTGTDVHVGAGDNQVANKNDKPDAIDGSLIGIIVGSCVGAILVVILIIIVCCVYQRKKPSSPASTTRDHFSAADESIISLPPMKNQITESSEYDLPWSRPLPHPPLPGATLQSSGYISDGTQYACIPIEQYNNACQQQQTTGCGSQPRNSPCLHHYMTSGGLLTLPGIHHERHHCNNVTNRPVNTLPANAHNNLLIPLNCKGQVVYDPNSYDLVQPDTCASPYDTSNYRSSPSTPLPNIQGSTGNSVYGAHLALPTSQLEEEELPVIASESLRFREKLGAGQYGEVHLCELMTPNQPDNVRLVAVKKLQPMANEATKQDFVREIRIMSKLRHENIVQVLGVSSTTSVAASPGVVTEYMSRGDLHQFLQKHVPEGTVLLNKHTLNLSSLLYIASQIAQGMSYLEQLNVTHRDLAARNCLVGENYQVKISDFGMSRSLYSQQYYKVEGRVVLPIRWMAWESLLLGKFTTKSDVWSFGVTLWEIFSFAREQPLSRLPDDDVIANCMNFYHNNLHEVVTLSQPSHCPKEIYDLMRACWIVGDLNRPTFKEVAAFLQNKSSLSSAQSNTSINPQNRRTSLTRLTTC